MIPSDAVRRLDGAKVAHSGRWNWPTLLMWLTLSLVSLAAWALLARGVVAVFALL